MNKKVLLLAAITLAFMEPTSAQTTTDFRTYGNSGYDLLAGVAADSVGNSVVFGTYQGTLNAGNNIILQSQKSSADFFLIKRDSTGQTIWAKSFGANDTVANHAWYQDVAADISMDKFGNIYLLGEVNCSADIVFGNVTLSDAQTPTAKNVFVSMFDKNGNCKWLTVNSTNPNASPKKIVVDEKKRCSITGGAYGGEAFGTYTLSGSGNYVAMFDSTGMALWAKSYKGTITGLAPDQQGYVYCSGHTSFNQFDGTSLTLKGNADLVLAKIDSSGALTWVKNEGAPGVTLAGYAIERRNNQVYVLASHTGSLSFGAGTLSGSSKFFLAAFDLQGINQWVRSTEVASSWGDPAYCDLKVNKKNELFALMNSSSSFSFGTSVINAPGVSSILLKYDAAGSPDWGINYASNVNYGSNTKKLSYDNYDHLFIAGYFSGSMAIAGSATLSVFGNGNTDGFAAILKSQNLTVGLNEFYINSYLNLFPNPVNDVLNLNIENGSDHDYYITNQLGKIVSAGALSSVSTSTLDVSEFTSGIYFIHLSDKTGNKISGKFLITH